MSALNLPSRADWRHTYRFLLADGSAEPISDATPSIVLTHQATGAVVTLTIGDGLTAPEPGSNDLQVLVDRLVKAAWPAGLTTAEILLVWGDGFEESVAVDLLDVHASGAPSEGGLTQLQRAPDTTRVIRVASGPPGPPAAWGTIPGTLADQADLAGALAERQPADADLTAFAALAPADDALLQRKGGGWVGRTPAQVKADLALIKGDVGLGNVDNTSDANKPVSGPQQAALDGKVNASAIDTDPALAANSNSRIPSQAAIKAYADGLIAAQDAMVFKGVLDCSAEPDYPAADRGHTYRVSVAGKVGGGGGVNVEPADILICLADGTPAGAQGAVGAAWTVIQANLDGALVTASIGIAVQAFSAELATIAGLSPADGDLLQRYSGFWAARTLAQVKADMGLNQVDNTSDANKPVSGPQQAALDGKVNASAVDTDPTLAANSNSRVPSQAAVKAYADGLIAAQDAMVFKGVISAAANPNYPAADRGHTYRISVAGKIGGAAGVNVEAGDILICLTDGTAAGTQAAVGASWGVIQANLDGALLTTAIGSTVQAYSADLAAIAALFPADNDVLQRRSGAWINRTPAQLKADLALAKGDVGLGNVDNTSDANKPVSTPQQSALDGKLGAAAGHIGYRSGRLYTVRLTKAQTTVAAVADQLFAIPFYIGRSVTWDALAVGVTAAVAGSNFKAALYSDTTGASAGYPNAKLGEVTLSMAATGNILVALGATVAPPEGWYWLMGLASHAATLSAIASDDYGQYEALGHSIGGVFTGCVHGLISSGYGYANGLPPTAPAGMLYQNNAMPIIAIRAA